MSAFLLLPLLLLLLLFKSSQQFTVRGRGWNRGNHHGNGIHSNPSAAVTQSEDWDPEFTPKSKKYYLVGESTL